MRKSFAMFAAAVIASAASAALAQDKADDQKVREVQKENSVPPTTGPTLPEQNAKTEPSSKIPDTNPQPHAFVNGVLTAPGAARDVDTAPAKFSERTKADDQLPIAGYRLKHITADQRSEIVQGLGSERGAPSTSSDENGPYARLGAEVPSSVALAGLTAMPEALTTKFPGLRGTAFMRAGGKVLVVDLDNSIVVGVL